MQDMVGENEEFPREVDTSVKGAETSGNKYEIQRRIRQLNMNNLIEKALKTQLPPINLVETEEHGYVSLDNRRLFIYKMLNQVTGVDFVPPQKHIYKTSDGQSRQMRFSMAELQLMHDTGFTHRISGTDQRDIAVRNGDENEMAFEEMIRALELAPSAIRTKCRQWGEHLKRISIHTPSTGKKRGKKQKAPENREQCDNRYKLYYSNHDRAETTAHEEFTRRVLDLNH